MSKFTRLFALITALLTALMLPLTAACAKTVAQWLEGFDTGASWFGDNVAYDVTDEAACWELLMKPITVLDVNETQAVYPLKEPNGKKVNNDKLGGFINGASAAVHVLGEDEDGWTLIEGLDYYNRLIRGYVKTKLLKTVTPNEKYGVIIDKLTQRLYVFIDGKLWSSCLVSTGLPNSRQPYNETASGEYICVSWSGGFDSEGMYCDMAIRFNSGDKIHEVPCKIAEDGTKDYDRWEAALGQKASHGCVRVARIANEDGLNQRWLWDNLKRGTKVVIWDDYGRALPYPEDSLTLYYNPEKGKNYHTDPECESVRKKYRPLTAFTYGELETEPYSKLEPCSSCVGNTVKRKSVIDKENEARGAVTPNKQSGGVSGDIGASSNSTPNVTSLDQNAVITVSDSTNPDGKNAAASNDDSSVPAASGGHDNAAGGTASSDGESVTIVIRDN